MTDTLRQSRLPLYLQIAEILRQRLKAGVWKPGDLLPTITELAAQYSVGKITIRQAVKLLEGEGLLESRRGRGTMALTPPTKGRQLRLGTQLSSLVDMYRGDKAELDLLEDRDAEIPGTPLIGHLSENGYHLLRRTHSRDGETYCVIALYFDMAIFDRHEQRLRTELALPLLFDSTQIDIARAQQELTVGKCDLESAGLLSLSIGDPVANVRRVLCDAEDRILYLADVTYRGDFVRLEMDLLA